MKIFQAAAITRNGPAIEWYIAAKDIVEAWALIDGRDFGGHVVTEFHLYELEKELEIAY